MRRKQVLGGITDSGLLTTSRRYVEVIDCVSCVEREGSALAMPQTRYYANQAGSPLLGFITQGYSLAS